MHGVIRVYNCDRICQKGLIRAITNIEKYRFEILNAVYLENAQSFFHAILQHSTVIQGNSFSVLFNGLLAEFPASLDSFFTSTTTIKDHPSTRGRLTRLRKQPWEKQTDALLAITHTCMASSMVWLSSDGKICALKWCVYKTPSCKSGHNYRNGSLHS